MITIKEDVTKAIQSIMNFDIDSAMVGIGVGAIEIINDRIEGSKEPSGRKFKKYTDKYEKMKRESGRNTKPDLHWTGEMLNAMQSNVVETNKGQSTIVNFSNRIHSESTQTIEQIAMKNDSIRPFLELNDFESQRLIDQFFTNPLNELGE